MKSHANCVKISRCVFLALVLCAVAAGQTVPTVLVPPQYGMLTERDVPIPMRDGISLVADVHRPSQDGKVVAGQFPVVLIRTCYNKDSRPISFFPGPEYFATRGYVVVIEDTRGRYKSPGHFYHGIYETKDGYDTIEWIANQPWSNGKVGMIGVSYLAAVQQAAAVSGAKHLTSIFHVQAPMSYYQNGVRRNGAFIQMVVPIAFLFASTSKEAAADPVIKKAEMDAVLEGPHWLEHWPFGKGRTPLKFVPEDERFFFDTWYHTDYDDFYKSNPLWEPNQYLDKWADIPSYYVGGWWDLYREDIFYSVLSKRQKQPIKLLIGPWAHGSWNNTLGDVDFGPDAGVTADHRNELELRWFEQTLKGVDTNSYSEPPVRIFRMGGGDGTKSADGKLRHGGQWLSEKTWPLPNTQFTNYYLGENDSLSPVTPTVAASSTSYIYDPLDPVPTVGSASYYFIDFNKPSDDPNRWYVPYGPQDQRETKNCYFCKTTLPLSTRQDVLVFETAPLDQDVEVTGPLNAKLWISSSAVDTDFTAKLIDVYPPSADYPEGYAMSLADGIQRIRYRNGYERPEMMKPGQVYPVTVELFATSNLFKKGHRIRLDISSSDYPAYDPNPNTGEPYMTGHHRIIARNTIYFDKDHASHIVLPIIDRTK